MESDLTQSALFYKLWAWGDKNRKQLLYGIVALVVLGFVFAFWLVHANEQQKDANAALAAITSRNLTMPNPPPAQDALLKVNADYPDTDGGQRALLLAAGDLFAAGKYDVAQAQFQKFLKDYNTSPFLSQAALGVAACNDALGKTNEAVSGYQGVVERFGNQNVEPQARLRLGRLLEGQGKYPEARQMYEQLAQKYQGSMMGSEGLLHLQALNTAHPEAPPAAPATPAALTAPNVPSLTTTPAATAPNTSAAPVATPSPAATNPVKK